MAGLLIIVALFALMYVLMIRPQRARAQQQRQLLGTVAPGDEVLTVGGIYGIVQELEPDEDGGDLIVEIADGIHVRVARKAVATVVKPDEDEGRDEDGGEAEPDDENGEAGQAKPSTEYAALPAGEEHVNDEQESVDPGAAGEAPSPGRS